MKKCALVLSLLLIVGAGYGQTERVEMKKTAILGFANLGTKSDDSLNIIFTKSLVNFIGRMPRTAIADYDETKVVCDTFNYPSGKQIDIKTASKIGAKLGCEQVVYGDFTVDNKAGKVAVNVVIMNVKTGETVYSQAFNGLSGLDIFDTVDSMIAAVAGKVTGRVIELAKLTVRIDGEGSFRLWLNGVDVQELTKSASFSESFSAGDPVMVAILDSEKRVVTNEMVMLEKGENRQIVYKAPIVELAKVETNAVAVATDTNYVRPKGQKKITDISGGSVTVEWNKDNVQKGDLIEAEKTILKVVSTQFKSSKCKVVKGDIKNLSEGMMTTRIGKQVIKLDSVDAYLNGTAIVEWVTEDIQIGDKIVLPTAVLSVISIMDGYVECKILSGSLEPQNSKTVFAGEGIRYIAGFLNNKVIIGWTIKDIQPGFRIGVINTDTNLAPIAELNALNVFDDYSLFNVLNGDINTLSIGMPTKVLGGISLPMNIISASFITSGWGTGFDIEYTRFINNWFGLGIVGSITTSPNFGIGINLAFRPFDWVVNPTLMVGGELMLSSSFILNSYSGKLNLGLKLNYSFIGIHGVISLITDRFSVYGFGGGLDFLF